VGRQTQTLRVLRLLVLVGLYASVQAQMQVFGDWVVLLRTDPITDDITTFVYAPAWDNPDRNEGSLMVRCRDEVLEIYFNLGGFAELERDSLRVTPIYRLDKEEPVTVRGGGVSTSGEAFFFPADGEEELLGGFRRASNFVFRIENRRNDLLTYQVSLDGFAEAYEYAALGACEE